MAKKALITGVTGQDGAYLARFLLDKGYEVHGMRRMASVLNTERISHLIASPQDALTGLNLHYGDMTDSSTLIHLVQRIQPDEIYNLAAQSHVRVSFDTPEYTANADGLGTLRLLEAMRILGLERHTRFYQASTSELFGKAQEPVQSETTPFYPRSPYAVAKLYAYWITVNYREAYGMYACNGILFNHESPIRGHSFVTRKITRGLARILVGLQDALYMGNLEARRDWGHARDYVEMQWLMLQQDTPEDYVIATGKDYSVRQVVEMACGEAGITLSWSGNGLEEAGRIETLDRSRAGALLKDTPLRVKEGDPIIRIDRYYFRPTEVDTLLGNPAKAKAKLGWEPRISVQEMIREMMASDAEQAVRDVHLESVGFRAIGLPEHV